MDKIEMAGDLLEMTRTIKDSVKRETWSALPGVIESFNPDAMTCTVHGRVTKSMHLPRRRDEQGQPPHASFVAVQSVPTQRKHKAAELTLLVTRPQFDCR
ncbi:hypothetical protein [Burkholderia cenocepacia]|uniref:hypothetical protein n=1 Tax=Burkholderia cenocepacia TaxID=95486 RepID=UPI0012AF7DFD|nr:hypothetical protein [Burkholderia cenocepacia]